MLQYSYSDKSAWTNYLIADAAASSVRSEIQSQTQAMIASNDRLAASMAADAQRLKGGLEQLDASLNWGFSSMLDSMGRLNDSLQELMALAKNPSQTWAFEQFDIARDAFRKQLFADALTYVESAIGGGSGQTGYRLEYRFHMLKGMIHLGSKDNTDQSLVDLAKAEAAFLEAAKYARADYPREAAQAMLSASWSCYCAGEMQRSEAHIAEALKLNPALPAAHYHTAKLKMHLGDPDVALPPLKQAISFDRNYTIKATEDADFLQYSEKLDGLYGELLEEERAAYEADLAALEARARDISKLLEFPLDKSKYFADFSAKKAGAAKCAEENTYFGFLDARAAVNAAADVLKEGARAYLNDKSGQYESEAIDLRNVSYKKTVAERVKSRARRTAWIVLLLLMAVFFVIAYQVASQQSYVGSQPGTGGLLYVAAMFTFVFMIFPGSIIHLIVKGVMRGVYSRSEEIGRQKKEAHAEAQVCKFEEKLEALETL